MDELRVLFQQKLNEITDIDSGVPIPDGMVEDGQTYFGYEISENYRGSDFHKDYTLEVSLTGRLVRKDNPEENTLQVLDYALEEIKSKLKDLNMKYSYNDVSMQDGIRKIFVKAFVRYNEMNNALIV